jgi:hypothetical protein
MSSDSNHGRSSRRGFLKGVGATGAGLLRRGGAHFLYYAGVVNPGIYR